MTHLLQRDASAKSTSGILSVIQDHKELTAEFYSRKITPAEQNYVATELEDLKVMAVILQFEGYLISSHFVVQPDHRALTFLDFAKRINPKISKWSL